MKTIKSIIVLALLSLFFVSCTQTDTSEEAQLYEQSATDGVGNDNGPG